MTNQDGTADDAMEDVFLQSGLSPTIAEHAAQCDSLLRKCMTVPDIVPDLTIMDDQLARFKLWASNMDVYGPLNVSLDYRLRFSPTVVEIIHQLLDIIHDTLTSRKDVRAFAPAPLHVKDPTLTHAAATVKPIDTRPPSPSRKRQRRFEREPPSRTYDDASDVDSEVDQAEENISKITDTVGGTVTRLFRLSNAVRKSAKADRIRRIDKYIGDDEANVAIAELRLYTECYVRFRFPEASDALRSALVEANALRLRRLFYQRSHRRRIALSVQKPEANAPVFKVPQIKDSPAAVRFAPGAQPNAMNISKAPSPAGAPRAPVTTATTARQSAVGAFYAKTTTPSQVPRAKSVLVNNKLSFPPIPPTQECPYCGVIVEFKSTQSMLWHNHVIGDIEPFICVFALCLEAGQHGSGPPTFETSKAWISHMQSAHGHVWECRAPSHDPIVFKQESEYQQHSIQEHGVPERHAGTLSGAARRPAAEKLLDCPFGDDFQLPETIQFSTVFSSDALQSHVAAHMKEIALLVLQKLPNAGDENGPNIDSDQPSDDDDDDGGQGVAQVRRSMYSLLDDDELAFDDDGGAVNGAEDISPSVRRLNLTDKDDVGMHALHSAAQAGNLPLAESLIQGGADVRSRDKSGRTALHYASIGQSHGREMMTLLLKAGGPAIVDLADDHGQTALHCAAERDFIDGIQVLLDHGAEARTVDSNGFSPFLWAVVAGQSRAAEKLLTIGADVNAASADGQPALAWAAGLGWSSIAGMLVDHGASMFPTRNTQMVPLEGAAASGDLSTVQLLVGLGVDPNYRDRDGWSAIHWAAEEGYLEIVRLLLDAGANNNAISSYGTTPLHCASNGGHVAVVGLLLRQHADPLKSDCHGWTALHHAAFMGHSDVVQCLLEDERIRSKASQQDNHGWSVLHLAVHSRDLATVDVLLGGSVIEEPRALFDDSGLTAEEWLDLGRNSHSYKATSQLAFSKSRCCRAKTGLRQAVIAGNIPMVQLLLRTGHPANGMNSGKRTALYYAAKKHMLPIMELLLTKGADPNILPTGRKAWQDFIADSDALLLLDRAGYRKRDTGADIEQQIRAAFRARLGPSSPDPASPMSPDESISPISERFGSPMHSQQTSPIVNMSEPFFPSISRGSLPVRLPPPTHQPQDNKRKAEGKSIWKRILR